MKTVRAVYEDGVFRPTDPPGLTEHGLVEFEPRPLETNPAAGSLGLREEDWPVTTEGIARHPDLMDRIEPPKMTAEDEAEWEDATEDQRDFEKARFDERAEKLRNVRG